MTILLAPNSVDTSKDGCLLGKVCAVSEYPVSTQEIQNRLRIDSLSQWIISSQQTALMEVSFDLIKDSASKSDGQFFIAYQQDYRGIFYNTKS